MKRGLQWFGLFASLFVAGGCESRALPDSGAFDAAVDDTIVDVVRTDVVRIDRGPTPCGTQTCAPGERCVDRVNVSGTAVIPIVDGSCPDGSVQGTSSTCRSRSESFECSPDPVTCGGVECNDQDASVGDGCTCAPRESAFACTCYGN